MEETRVPGDFCIEYTSPWAGLELTTFVVIGTDCIGSYKSNYHTITTTTFPQSKIQITRPPLHILYTVAIILCDKLMQVCKILNPNAFKTK